MPCLRARLPHSSQCSSRGHWGLGTAPGHTPRQVLQNHWWVMCMERMVGKPLSNQGSKHQGVLFRLIPWRRRIWKPK